MNYLLNGALVLVFATALTLFDFPLSVTHCEYCMHGLVSLDSVRNDIRPYVFNFIRILNKSNVFDALEFPLHGIQKIWKWRFDVWLWLCSLRVAIKHSFISIKLNSRKVPFISFRLFVKGNGSCSQSLWQSCPNTAN